VLIKWVNDIISKHIQEYEELVERIDQNKQQKLNLSDSSFSEKFDKRFDNHVVFQEKNDFSIGALSTFIKM
jgi:t-SNARE complex subunit (syntaxin)